MTRNLLTPSEVASIRDNFALRDRQNIDAGRGRTRPSDLVFDKLSTNESLGRNTLRGLTYPLKLDGRGGLSMSYGYDRIAQSIQEVLETRIGERVGNPFLGTRELLFETISEDIEARNIKRQILAAVPYLSEESLSVSMSIGEDGTCYINVRYAVENTTITVRVP